MRIAAKGIAISIGRRPMRSEIAPPTGSQNRLETPMQSVIRRLWMSAKCKNALAVGRRVGGDQVERGRRERRQHHARQHERPVVGDDTQHLGRARVMLLRLERVRFLPAERRRIRISGMIRQPTRIGMRQPQAAICSAE